QSSTMTQPQPSAFMMARHFRQVPIFLSVLYLTLASLGMYCHASNELHQPTGQHHSKHSVTHSLLCTWACQVSTRAQSADAAQHTLLMPLIILIGVVALWSSIPTQAFLRPTAARGPPN
ncbi:MAG: hypothetical protein KC643_27665, partial [Nitrospira sp.]|nr:hypothetical protein [Nitrospira sp.]